MTVKANLLIPIANKSTSFTTTTVPPPSNFPKLSPKSRENSSLAHNYSNNDVNSHNHKIDPNHFDPNSPQAPHFADNASSREILRGLERMLVRPDVRIGRPTPPSPFPPPSATPLASSSLFSDIDFEDENDDWLGLDTPSLSQSQSISQPLPTPATPPLPQQEEQQQQQQLQQKPTSFTQFSPPLTFDTLADFQMHNERESIQAAAEEYQAIIDKGE